MAHKRNGVVLRQDGHERRRGVCTGRCVWPVHGFDGLRHPLPRARRARRRGDPLVAAAQAAAQARLQGHGPALVEHGQELRRRRRALQRHRVRHRGPARQERPRQRRRRGLPDGRHPRPQRRAAGGGRRLRRLRGVQRSDRCLDEDAEGGRLSLTTYRVQLRSFEEATGKGGCSRVGLSVISRRDLAILPSSATGEGDSWFLLQHGIGVRGFIA